MVDSRWATTMQVIPRSLMERTTSYSVFASKADVASSKIIIGASLSITLVRDNEHRSRQIYSYNPEKKTVGAALAYFVAVPLNGWKDFKEYYQCKEVFVSDFSDAEEVMSDLYDTTDFEFDYERRIVELYY